MHWDTKLTVPERDNWDLTFSAYFLILNAAFKSQVTDRSDKPNQVQSNAAQKDDLTATRESVVFATGINSPNINHI
jgi:hypothetical protein